MRSLLLSSMLVVCASLSPAQTMSSAPVLLGAGPASPFPLPVAPGQLLTLYVQTSAASSTMTLPAISATYWNGSSQENMPVLQVVQPGSTCNAPSRDDCAQVLAMTVQVPLDVAVICPLCASPFVVASSISVAVNGVNTSYVDVQPLQNHVHFLTECDVIIAGAASAALFTAGLPCAPIVTHADGRGVSNILPATAGEELVAYATGLGQTNPALTTGQPAAQSSPTIAAFSIDFNYRVNALATQPGTVGSSLASPCSQAPPRATLACIKSTSSSRLRQSVCSPAWIPRR